MFSRCRPTIRSISSGSLSARLARKSSDRLGHRGAPRGRKVGQVAVGRRRAAGQAPHLDELEAELLTRWMTPCSAAWSATGPCSTVSTGSTLAFRALEAGEQGGRHAPSDSDLVLVHAALRPIVAVRGVTCDHPSGVIVLSGGVAHCARTAVPHQGVPPHERSESRRQPSGWASAGVTFAGCILGPDRLVPADRGPHRDPQRRLLRPDARTTRSTSTRPRGAGSTCFIGVLLIITASGCSPRAPWAGVAAIVLAILSAIENFFFIPYYPVLVDRADRARRVGDLGPDAAGGDQDGLSRSSAASIRGATWTRPERPARSSSALAAQASEPEQLDDARGSRAKMTMTIADESRLLAGRGRAVRGRRR